MSAFNSESELSLFEEDSARCELVSVVLLGASGVGKTSIAQRFATGQFTPGATTVTIGIEYQQKQIWIAQDSVPVNATLYDTAGQERYSSMNRSYYRRADAAIIVFDLTDNASLQRALLMRTALEEERPDAPCVLVGNKSDKLAHERGVRADQAALEKIAHDFAFALGFIEISASTDARCADRMVADLATHVVDARRRAARTNAAVANNNATQTIIQKTPTIKLTKELVGDANDAGKKSKKKQSFC